MMRSHYSGDVNAAAIDQEITVCGWVHRRRDHGGVIFLDLRDRTGLVQVVFDPDTEEAFALADKVRGEYVLQLEGRVRLRDESVRNPRMDTGDIEVLGLSLTILNEAQTPPFELDEYSAAGEEVRLKYRYLDLRRPEALKRFQFRSRLTHAVRAPLAPVDSQVPFPRMWFTAVWINGWCTWGGFLNSRTSSLPSTLKLISVSEKTGHCNSPFDPVKVIRSSVWSALKFQTPVPTLPDSNSKPATVTSSARYAFPVFTEKPPTAFIGLTRKSSRSRPWDPRSGKSPPPEIAGS